MSGKIGLQKDIYLVDLFVTWYGFVILFVWIWYVLVQSESLEYAVEPLQGCSITKSLEMTSEKREDRTYKDLDTS
jgi:hypothetical protein